MNLAKEPFKNINLGRTFQEAWYLKLNDPTTQRALWLRFTLLSSKNGFKRVAETWAVYFQRTQNKEVKKVALKQTHSLDAFFTTGKPSIRIGNCELLADRTRGSIVSKGQSIQWDLSLTQGRQSAFTLVPELFSRSGLLKNSMSTLCEDLVFSGTSEINGEKMTWDMAPGMQGHLRGSKTGHSWVWGHCNTFVNENGKPTDFVFEGLTARGQVGPMVTPKRSSFFFYYQNKNYLFNTLKDAFQIRSKTSMNEWSFQADRGDLSFRGYVKAEHKDFVGLTLEDTNGSLLYCSNTELADLKVLVYRSGKLEATLTATGTAAFETVSREKSPYVGLLL